MILLKKILSQKLKEVKAKSKIRELKLDNIFEGLLRIPFGIYKEEPILNVMAECNKLFCELVKTIQESDYPISSFQVKECYTGLEVRKYTDLIKNNHQDIIKQKFKENIIQQLIDVKRNELISNICHINSLIRKYTLSYPRICHSGKKPLI